MVFSNVVDLDQGFYGPNYTDVSIDLRKIGSLLVNTLLMQNITDKHFLKHSLFLNFVTMKFIECPRDAMQGIENFLLQVTKLITLINY